jgi:hypothetical protein
MLTIGYYEVWLLPDLATGNSATDRKQGLQQRVGAVAAMVNNLH